MEDVTPRRVEIVHAPELEPSDLFGALPDLEGQLAGPHVPLHGDDVTSTLTPRLVPIGPGGCDVLEDRMEEEGLFQISARDWEEVEIGL